MSYTRQQIAEMTKKCYVAKTRDGTPINADAVANNPDCQKSPTPPQTSEDTSTPKGGVQTAGFGENLPNSVKIAVVVFVIATGVAYYFLKNTKLAKAK